MNKILYDLYALGAVAIAVLILAFMDYGQWVGFGLEAFLCCLVIVLACTRR